MASPTRSQLLDRIRVACLRPGASVLFDEPSLSLYDVAAGKSLALDLANLEAAEERKDTQSAAPYLVLLFADGHRLAVGEAGIAFAPSLENSGPVELPPAVCLRDHALLVSRVRHALYDHPEQPPTRETLGLVMSCIAILDGARAAGFDVAREERALEEHLAEVERRAARA